MPNSVVIHWPSAPTVSDPGVFPEVASAIVKLFAGASTKLASIQVQAAVVKRQNRDAIRREHRPVGPERQRGAGRVTTRQRNRTLRPRPNSSRGIGRGR